VTILHHRAQSAELPSLSRSSELCVGQAILRRTENKNADLQTELKAQSLSNVRSEVHARKLAAMAAAMAGPFFSIDVECVVRCGWPR
jgi:hypothetical protein